MLPSPSDRPSNQLPTPPESVLTGGLSMTTPGTSLSPPGVPQQTVNVSPPYKLVPSQPQPSHVVPPGFAAAATAPRTAPQHHPPQQRPLPAASSPSDWFSPPAPFISPYNFGPMSAGTGTAFFNDAMPNNFADTPTGLGLQKIGLGIGIDAAAPLASSCVPPGRQGSLAHQQQLELMNVLETEGVDDIDAFLNAEGDTMVDRRWF